MHVLPWLLLPRRLYEEFRIAVKAAWSAARQKPVSMVLESPQLSTKRLGQSITATMHTGKRIAASELQRLAENIRGDLLRLVRTDEIGLHSYLNFVN